MDTKYLEPLQQYFYSGQTLSLDSRKSALNLLKELIRQHEREILSNLKKDLGKGAIEAYSSEISYVLSEIDLALKKLRAWTKPKSVKTSPFLWPAKSYYVPTPKGVVLILGPWNYPFQLLLAPLAGALAAGNCVVLKPSEHAPNTAALLEKILNSAFHPEYVRVVQGNTEFSRDLCALSWDHIFFTGSTQTGRAIMKQAAENLTSVTLELGGKNPCIVFKDADPILTAQRIAWGKFLNAGQTCVAPDTLYVEKSMSEKLVDEIVCVIQAFFGQDPKHSPDYGRIVNAFHVKRLSEMIKDCKAVTGGFWDEHSRYFAPTVVTEIPFQSSLLTDEVFGPVLPVVEFEEINSLLNNLQKLPVPLALYVFTRNKSLQELVLRKVRSGTAAINDTLRQVTSHHLPFGGMRESGMGAYHGKAGFDCFSHNRSILKAGFKIYPTMHHPPYKTDLKWLKRILRFLV